MTDLERIIESLRHDGPATTRELADRLGMEREEARRALDHRTEEDRIFVRCEARIRPYPEIFDVEEAEALTG